MSVKDDGKKVIKFWKTIVYDFHTIHNRRAKVFFTKFLKQGRLNNCLRVSDHTGIELAD